MQVNTIDEILSPGHYKVDACGVTASDGFPDGVDGSCLSAYLEVSDTNHSADNLKSAAVGQTLTYTNSVGNTAVYHRSAINNNGIMQWKSWVDLGAAASTDIQDGAITAPKLSADVQAHINNNTAAISAERTRAMGQEGLLNEAFEEERQRAIQAENDAVVKGRQLALRALFVAAGAEYNDTEADKVKTAPWGETVTHKAGHYYLNGLGDITEEQMLKIYIRGYFNDNDIAAFGYNGVRRANDIRVNLCRTGMWNATLNSYLCYTNNQIEVLNLHVYINPIDKATITFPQDGNMFYNATLLKIIMPACNLVSESWSSLCFVGCKSLQEVRITRLKSNISFADSTMLSKSSLLYMIQNATATSVITITLHHDAYLRLADDVDVVAALNAQPLVSLVSV